MTKEAIALLEKARSVARVAEPNKAGYECIEQHIGDALTLLKQQPPAGDEMTKKFNAKTEELKSMFVVSQAMARNSFDATLQSMEPIEGKAFNPDPPPAKHQSSTSVTPKKG